MKRVLIITYYWPPSGGGGVMRWLKMSRYLPELGWKPIIYTPKNPDPSITDKSLLSEIHEETEELKTHIWEPYGIYRRLTHKSNNSQFKAGYISEASTGSWRSKLSVFIRGNFLIPDPRKFWIRPSIKYLSKFLKENRVDLIVSTGPPHSMHLIALGLKKRFDIPWIADFRDPWTGIDFYPKLRLTKWADRKHRELELKVLNHADHVVTVSPGCAADLSNISNKKTDVIYNGYDPADFKTGECELDKTFTISHFGAFNKDRNPGALWRALNELSGENPEFNKLLHIRLIGQTDESIINDIRKNGLSGNLSLTDHLPHSEGLTQLCKSQVLLLPINDVENARGILPGKMYEYLALKRPILAIGPADADFATILKETNSGVAHNFGDMRGMKQTVEEYFNLFRENKLEVDSNAIEKFSRKNLAKKFIEILQG